VWTRTIVDDDNKLEERRQCGQMMQEDFISAKTLFLERCKEASNYTCVMQKFEQEKHEKPPLSPILTSSHPPAEVLCQDQNKVGDGNLGVTYSSAYSACCPTNKQVEQ